MLAKCLCPLGETIFCTITSCKKAFPRKHGRMQSTISRVVPTFDKHDLGDNTYKFSFSINILCKCIGTELTSKDWILL